MRKQNNTVSAVEAFLHDMEQGEYEYSEIFNVMGVNELTYLVKMAKKGEMLTASEEASKDEQINCYLPCKEDCEGSIPMWFNPETHVAQGACFMCGEKKEFTLIPHNHVIGTEGIKEKESKFIIGVDLASEPTENAGSQKFEEFATEEDKAIVQEAKDWKVSDEELIEKETDSIEGTKEN